MTNQEALKEMCINCQKLMAEIPTKEDKDSIEIHSCGHQMCPWRVISNDYCEEYETLKKAIDRLEEVEKENNYFKNACAEFDKSITKYAEKIRMYEKTIDLAIKEINKGVDGLSKCPKKRDCLNDDWIEERDCDKCWKDYLQEKARKELENEKL